MDIEQSDSACPHCIASGYELLTLLPEQNLEMVTTQVVPWKGNAPHIAWNPVSSLKDKLYKSLVAGEPCGLCAKCVRPICSSQRDNLHQAQFKAKRALPLPTLFISIKTIQTRHLRGLLFDWQVDNGVGLGRKNATELYTFFSQLVIERYHCRRPEKYLEMVTTQVDF